MRKTFLEQSGNSCNKAWGKLCRIHLAQGDPSEKKRKKAAGVEHNFAVWSPGWGKLSRQQKKHTRNRIQSKKSKPVWEVGRWFRSSRNHIEGINESEQSWNMIFLYCYSTVFKSQCSSWKQAHAPQVSPHVALEENLNWIKEAGGRKIKVSVQKHGFKCRQLWK